MDSPIYARSKIYKILSCCFCYPDQNFVHYAENNLLEDLAGGLKELPYTSDLQNAYEFIRSVLAEEMGRRSLEDWQTEYTGLFIYCRGAVSCSPYETTWTDGSKRLNGESTADVRRFYRDFKLRVARQFADLPDHIAAELEFMHFLSHNEAKFEADGKNRERFLCMESQASFLKDHLQPWVPKLAERLEKNSESRFFTILSPLASTFLSAESKHLKTEEKAGKQTNTLPTDMPSIKFDTSTLTVLETDETAPGSKVKWMHTTLPERFPCSPVKVKVVDGTAVEVVTRNDLPFFSGKHEVRAFASIAKLYGTDKLKFPLKRVGERGEGKFKRIRWDEALDEIATVLKKYRDEGNARSVAFLRTHPPLENMFNHFTHHYGTPNDVHVSTTSCYADGAVADDVTGGHLGEDDYLNAKYALYIGHNLLNGIRALPLAARFAEGIRRGMKFVFVDPRLNEGSYTYGAEWVPIKPGTDAAFVLALMNVIINEKLYDPEFLLGYTNAPILIKPDRYPLKDKNGNYLVWDLSINNVKPLGEAVQPALLGSWDVDLDTDRGICKTAFQELAERADEYTPEKASGITTMGKEKIEEIARDLGTMKPRVAIFSRQNVSAQYSNSLQYCRARNVLMCLLGIFDKPGGKYYGASGPVGLKLNHGKDFRIPIRTYPMSKERVDFDPTVHAHMNTTLGDRYPLGVIQNFLQTIKTGEPYPIQVLFIIGCDVRASHSGEWKDAFKKVEFIVKSHVWPDDDVDYADIVLPEAAYLERDDGFEVIIADDPENIDAEFSFLSVTPKVVEPQFEERAWTDYMKELAQRIGFGKHYDFSLDEYWNFLLEPTGIDIEYLRKHGVYCPTPRVRRKVEFGKKHQWRTDTGRLNIYSSEMAELWHKRNQNPLFDPIPIYHAIPVEPKAENEFYLINGKCSYFWCDYYRDSTMLLERYLEGELGNTLLWINAQRATALGIKDREWVWIESEATGAKDRVMVKVTEGIHPSAVWHVYGYGHRSSLMDKASRAREGINVNEFVPEHKVPWTAGQAHCEAVVKVYKA